MIHPIQALVKSDESLNFIADAMQELNSVVAWLVGEIETIQKNEEDRQLAAILRMKRAKSD